MRYVVILNLLFKLIKSVYLDVHVMHEFKKHTQRLKEMRLFIVSCVWQLWYLSGGKGGGPELDF